jgi:hypothetical protein
MTSAVALAACTRVQPVQPASSLPELSLVARPVRNGAPQIQYLAVQEDIRGAIDQRKPLSLRVGIVHTGRRGIADRVDSLAMRDAAGVVPLKVEDDPVNASGYTHYRHWRAERQVQPPVTVTYRMRPVPRPTGGPQYEFYAHAGGMNAAGMQLFVLPETIDSAHIRLKWDLSDLAPGSMVVSTYGEGDLDLRGSPDTITRPFYLAGPLGKYEPPTPNAAFRAYWIGRPTFNPLKEMQWTFQSYDYLRKFYRDTTVKMYRVFIHAAGSGGGTGSSNSFMGSASPGNEDTTLVGPRNMLTHEIGHYFVGGLSGGAQGSGPWYGEGLNTHYTRLLLLRNGLAPVSEYLKDINDRARAYYTSAYRNYSNDSLTKIGYSTGFGGASAQNLAYSRGSLFWSELDYRIRQASRGTRTLDDMILPLLEARRKGTRMTQETIVNAIVKELGQPGREFFEWVIIRGQPLMPASGAFGPCFERRSTKYTANGQEFDGYEWVRVQSVPDEKCREW